ncbi:DUF4252 domain-containing protein [Chryseobacterium koreense]|uniref:DUF4252 domain-containing protein n=1 Tax=Chryseobacterium koreense TaxID=232216 RepID=UPI0026EFFF08|nr:DUF4252 domain-containing protein [Chryseobacterium koreense]
MQKILIIFAFFFSHFFNVNAQKDKLDLLFDKYQESEGVTSIKIAKPMFSMLGKLNIDDAELSQIKPLLNKINGLKILIVEKPDPKIAEKDGTMKLNLFQNLQNDISASIKNLKYEELITVNSKANKIKFLSSDVTNGNLENLLLSINSEGNTVLMMLDGKISMEDVNKLINEAEKPFQENTVSTSTPSGENRNVPKFSGIKVSNGINVSFTQNPEQKVLVDTDANLQQYVKTEVAGDILKIYVDNSGNKRLNFKKINVFVSAPELNKIAVNSGSSFSTLNTLNSSYFQIATSSRAHLKADLSTKGKVELSTTSGSEARLKVEAENLEMSATSGSSATLYGKISETAFDVSSASTVNAQDLVSQISTVNASSAASLKVNVAKSLKAEISSAASVRYRANSNLDRNAKITSGGSLKPL